MDFIKLPKDVEEIISRLEKNGFKAFAVGGCVRDSLMGIQPNDWDICTDAPPEEIKRTFDGFKTLDIGIKHGTVSLVIDKKVYEITTLRIDGEYTDNRRPESVEFTSDITADLSRRDFTVNAIAYNEKYGIIDPFGGTRDIELNAIRCVGDPEARFKEDALRIMRALRFASVYDMSIEINTAEAVLSCAHLLNNIAGERIASELNKLICGESCEYILRRFKSVFAVIIPEIEIMFDYGQDGESRGKTLWKHTVRTVSLVEPEPLLRMTMLLHDIGKPLARRQESDGTYSYGGYPKFSAAIAEVILERLRYPKDFIESCLALISRHDISFSGEKPQIKRVMNEIGEENMRRLIKIQCADIMARPIYKREEGLLAHDLLCASFEEIIKENECYNLKSLAVNGRDLIHIGITDGKAIGKTLNALLCLVTDEKCANEKDLLLKAARALQRIEK